MKEFTFTGDWETEFYLGKLCLLRNEERLSSPYREELKAALDKGIVTLEIGETLDHNPDPSPAQLSTIHYIQQNEDRLLEAIHHWLVHQEYPFLKTLMDDEDDSFPPLETVNDLTKALGIQSVAIFDLEKDGYAYFLIRFMCTWDYEHGYSIIFHKDRVIDTADAMSYSLEKTCKDAGVDHDKYNDDFNSWEDNVFEWIEPHPKYGRLKAIEISSNRSLPERLIEQQKNDILIEYIKQGKIDINCAGLLPQAVYMQNELLINYFLENKIRLLGNVFTVLQKVNNPKIEAQIEQYYQDNKDWVYVDRR